MFDDCEIEDIGQKFYAFHSWWIVVANIPLPSPQLAYLAIRSSDFQPASVCMITEDNINYFEEV